MNVLKTYEGFLDRFKKKEEEKYPSKEELLDWISDKGARFRLDFRTIKQKFSRSFLKKKNKMHDFTPGIISKAIMYDKRKDQFLLVYQGKVDRIRYDYDDLILLAKENDASINEVH